MIVMFSEGPAIDTVLRFDWRQRTATNRFLDLSVDLGLDLKNLSAAREAILAVNLTQPGLIASNADDVPVAHAARVSCGMEALSLPRVFIWIRNCCSNGMPAAFQRWTV